MSQQKPEQTQFYLTAATPCPYLDGRKERKLFTHLGGKRANMLHDLLAQHGFRRSQNIVYRPACDSCSACQSARIPVDAFEPDRSQRRVSRRNADLVTEERFPLASAEQYELFKRYLNNRHTDGGMAAMSFLDYEYMIEDTPVESMVVEYRLPGRPRTGLVAAALTDVLPDGLSMVYSFFDPDAAGRSLGNYMILDHVRRARAAGLPYVYLGYWVKESPKMAYKGRYRPLEVLSDGRNWTRVD
ncbi:arginyltransferase [Cucumibacter marinus]|uniref:arginyltransferase n=1 Tax=Cucumibacter marinus TaxID=1121252 RepID=UPI00041F2CC6|nr:arginyltransferase [Cucumibacter marinus]